MQRGPRESNPGAPLSFAGRSVNAGLRVGNLRAGNRGVATEAASADNGTGQDPPYSNANASLSPLLSRMNKK